MEENKLIKEFDNIAKETPVKDLIEDELEINDILKQVSDIKKELESLKGLSHE